MSHYLFSEDKNFQVPSSTAAPKKTKHFCAVLYFIPYVDEKRPMKPLIPIYHFSDCVTSKDHPWTPSASSDVFTGKGIYFFMS